MMKPKKGDRVRFLKSSSECVVSEVHAKGSWYQPALKNGYYTIQRLDTGKEMIATVEGLAILLQVVESLSGLWHYHLATENHTEGLCGVKTMVTEISVDSWGAKSHLNENWCKDCARLAGLQKES